MMAAETAKKAYAVTEHWRVGKSILVWANTVEEAKEKVRASEETEDVMVLDQSYAEPVRIEARREPQDDRP